MERLRDVVVRPDFQADDAVDHVASPGQHDDADARANPEFPSDDHAVLARQGQVEQDDIRRMSGERLEQRTPARRRADAKALRSEEHTSELQSLMRISYAVFCLKKKTM